MCGCNKVPVTKRVVSNVKRLLANRRVVKSQLQVPVKTRLIKKG
jgi:hypothetical protein